ncbi:hypothetical protein EC973_002126 [Apophysomyces ossiformis]|uniref:F-box domain-containing protein n=1 Tax=Apophysomyces ossiformis TaxID=679940 RepID=A0A8H7ELW8_9FUNG|nr:hypothetical protein EC973_002126 [Apophysomyces ossiformis]
MTTKTDIASPNRPVPPSASSSYVANQLPNEIIVNIGDRLPNRTLCILVRLCRSWYAALIPRLYHSVTIDSEELLEKFFKAMLATASHKKLFHFVHELHFTSRAGLCTNVMRALCDTRRSQSNSAGGEAAWLPFLQTWKNLSVLSTRYFCSELELKLLARTGLHLSLTTLSMSICQWEACADTFEALPSVESLKIDFLLPNDWRPKTVPFSYLETIHGYFPRLKEFEVLCLRTCGEIPEYVQPCATVRLFSVRAVPEARSWGEYFARKYPKLETLDLPGSRNENIDMAIEAKRLVRSCYHLRRLVMINDEVCRALINILLEIGAPLERLWLGEQERPLFPKLSQSFRQTLTHVVFYGGPAMPIKEVLAQLKICPSLTNLSLFRVTPRLEVDHILTEIEGLKILSLAADDIGLSSNHNDEATVRLAKIESVSLTGQEIEDEVYHWLSPRCPRLTSLELNYGLGGYRIPVIYYPNPGLKFLSVQGGLHTVFKLTQISEVERVQLQGQGYNKLNELNETTGYTRWFGPPGFQGMRVQEPAEVEQLLSEIEVLHDGFCRRKSEEAKQIEQELLEECSEQAVPYTHLSARIFMIRCHFVDTILLSGILIT